MPNHTTNQLALYSSNHAAIRLFVSRVALKNGQGDDETFNFNGVVPMPEELRNTASPTRVKTQAEIDEEIAEWEKNNPDPDKFAVDFKPRSITQETHDRLMDAYGATNWYDWAIDNWGTKWGAYHAGQWDLSHSGKKLVAVIRYHTAWSPPRDFLIHASEEFPDIVFENSFADEGGSFLGMTTYERGRVVSEENIEWNSSPGITFRKSLGVYFDENEEQDSDGDTFH